MSRLVRLKVLRLPQLHPPPAHNETSSAAHCHACLGHLACNWYQSPGEACGGTVVSSSADPQAFLQGRAAICLLPWNLTVLPYVRTQPVLFCVPEECHHGRDVKEPSGHLAGPRQNANVSLHSAPQVYLPVWREDFLTWEGVASLAHKNAHCSPL